MKLAELSQSNLNHQLQRGLSLQIGSFVVKIKSSIPAVARGLALLYAEYPIIEDSFADFHVELRRAAGVRGWVKPQVEFVFDGQRPFKPLPLPQAFDVYDPATGTWTYAVPA